MKKVINTLLISFIGLGISTAGEVTPVVEPAPVDVTYMFSGGPMAGYVGGDYDSFSAGANIEFFLSDWVSLDASVIGYEDTLSDITYTGFLNAIVYCPAYVDGPVVPYVFGGVGINYSETRDWTEAFDAGVGVSVQITDTLELFARGSYMWIGTNGSATPAGFAGVRYSF